MSKNWQESFNSKFKQAVTIFTGKRCITIIFSGDFDKQIFKRLSLVTKHRLKFTNKRII